MKKAFYSFLLVMVISLSLVGCEGFYNTGNKENDITQKYVKVENITIDGFQNLIQTAIEKVEHSVIGVTHKENNLDVISIGSGVVYQQEINLVDPSKGADAPNNIRNYTYYAITNRHVVTDDNGDTNRLFAYMGYEDVEVEAELLGKDPKVDLAVIRFTCDVYIVPAEFADITSADPNSPDLMKKGSFAIAIGNPDGYDYFGSATMGIISSPIRYMADDTDGDGTIDFYGEYIQHDVAINPGNSGGGLFNIYGKLIGINTLKLVDSTIEGMGFAIPINIINKLVTEYLVPGQTIVRPKLGVTGLEVRNITPSVASTNKLKSIPAEFNYGLYVTAITPKGSVEGSGVKPDDIILEFDGKPIKYSYELMAEMSSLIKYHVDDHVEIKYWSRNADGTTGQVLTTMITLKP